MMSNVSNEQIVIQRPTWNDLPAIANLVAICDIAEQGLPALTEEDIRDEWHRPGFDPAHNAWMAVEGSGVIVGYATLVKLAVVRLDSWGCVHPDARGRGIGTRLLALIEQRALELLASIPTDRRVTLDHNINGGNESAIALLTANGYAHVRSFWHMAIRLDAPPPSPRWPAGMHVRTFEPEHEARALHAAVQEAFADHWGHEPVAFDEWRYRMERDSFDPSLWFLAWDHDQIVGAALCRYREDLGYVSNLSVRRAWRRRGLGLALLHHAFGEFYRRGTLTIGLDVDSESPTGATRLYDRAGMSVELQFDRYAKVLRRGIVPAGMAQ